VEGAESAEKERESGILKGDSHLFALPLQKAAAEVENQLKEGKNKVSDSQLITLDNELNVVLTELAPLLAEESEKKEKGKRIFDPHS